MINLELLDSFSVNEVNKILNKYFQGNFNEKEAKKVLTSLIVDEQSSAIGVKNDEGKKSFIFNSDKVFIIGAAEPVNYDDWAHIKVWMDVIRIESGKGIIEANEGLRR